MLHHISIGVDNVEKAAEFYDAILGTLGYRRLMQFLPDAIGYGDKQPAFWVQRPADGRTPSAGNGTHIALMAPSKFAVETFHRTALEHGGTDEGAPGPRPEYTPDYYGAFVRDAYGNKLEAILMIGAAAAPAKSKTKSRAKKAKPAAKRTASRGTRKSPGRKPSKARAKSRKR
jgi:catechol 2,3-dioxygenase-like lactoylglutathione lyase family enzyme